MGFSGETRDSFPAAVVIFSPPSQVADRNGRYCIRARSEHIFEHSPSGNKRNSLVFLRVKTVIYRIAGAVTRPNTVVESRVAPVAHTSGVSDLPQST